MGGATRPLNGTGKINIIVNAWQYFIVQTLAILLLWEFNKLFIVS